MMRQVFFDTETTGLSPKEGHRIIEIACLEVIDRALTGRHFHTYLNPDRDIEESAVAIHNITVDQLREAPRFADIVGDFLNFITDAELVAHNAPFDIGFLDAELDRLAMGPLGQNHAIVDTLKMARERFPAGRCSLDALCTRFDIDRSKRRFHGALIDTDLLVQVYLAMTRGQDSLALTEQTVLDLLVNDKNHGERPPIRIAYAADEDVESHRRYLLSLQKAAENGTVFWSAD